MLGKKVFSKHYWLSIKDVEQLLGWHRSKIRRWMKKGWLPFTLDANRYARFPRTEIEQFAQEQLGRIVHGAPAKVAAKAFVWFAEGKTWQEVVILLAREPGEAQPVEVVQKLYAQYLDEGRRDASSSTLERGSRPSQPELDDDDNDGAELPVADADEWRREQDKEARRAQAALEREERAWQEEQRQREQERAQRYPSLMKATPPPFPPEDEPIPLSERFAALLQSIAARKVAGS